MLRVSSRFLFVFWFLRTAMWFLFWLLFVFCVVFVLEVLDVLDDGGLLLCTHIANGDCGCGCACHPWGSASSSSCSSAFPLRRRSRASRAHPALRRAVSIASRPWHGRVLGVLVLVLSGTLLWSLSIVGVLDLVVWLSLLLAVCVGCAFCDMLGCVCVFRWVLFGVAATVDGRSLLGAVVSSVAVCCCAVCGVFAVGCWCSVGSSLTGVVFGVVGVVVSPYWMSGSCAQHGFSSSVSVVWSCMHMHVPCVGQSAHLVDPGSVGCAHCRGHWHRRHGHFVGHVHILRSQDVHCWLFVVMSAAHRNPDFRHVHLLRLLVVSVVGWWWWYCLFWVGWHSVLLVVGVVPRRGVWVGRGPGWFVLVWVGCGWGVQPGG